MLAEGLNRSKHKQSKGGGPSRSLSGLAHVALKQHCPCLALPPVLCLSTLDKTSPFSCSPSSSLLINLSPGGRRLHPSIPLLLSPFPQQGARPVPREIRQARTDG